MDTAILSNDLYKEYPGKPPVKAVCGLSLEVLRGECFGLLGPNGAGKTTTIEIMEGLLAPSSGEVRILGLSWGANDNEIRQRIGISLQETKLAEKVTVKETLTLFRSFYRKGRDPNEVMNLVALEEKKDTFVEKLSGGQRQRLAVATSLVGDPDLLFLDEPTTGLDPASRRQIWDIIQKFQGSGGTVLLTTHYMDEAQRLCTRVGIVNQGKMIALGGPDELIHAYGGQHIVDFSLEPQFADSVPLEKLTEQLSAITSVKAIHVVDSHFVLSVSELHVVLPMIFDSINHSGFRLTNLFTREPSLEDVFVRLTGRQLTEAGDKIHD